MAARGNPPAVRPVARAGLKAIVFIGSTSPSRRFRSDFAQDWQLMATQGEGTWGAAEGTQGTYNWRWVDNYYNFARNNNILFITQR